jgi:hypothetical protein
MESIPFHFKVIVLINLWNLVTTSNLFARYGAMIMEALSELNEPNGSDIAAIFRFIEVGYLHLLFSFDFTVLLQLFNVKLWSSFKFWLLLTMYLHLTVVMY